MAYLQTHMDGDLGHNLFTDFAIIIYQLILIHLCELFVIAMLHCAHTQTHTHACTQTHTHTGVAEFTQSCGGPIN